MTLQANQASNTDLADFHGCWRCPHASRLAGLATGSAWPSPGRGGVYKIVVTAGDSGGIAGVIAGALLLVSPFVIHRVEQFSLTTSGLEMRLSKDMADQGAPKAARILDRTDLAWFAQSYSFIHEELSAETYQNAREHIQDVLVERAAAIARREKFDASEVRTLFKNAAPTMRVLVLGLMEGDSSLADGPTIVDAIQNSRSANEQYQAMKLALQCWPTLPESYRDAVRTAVKQNPQIMDGTSRRALAEKILSRRQHHDSGSPPSLV